MSNVTIVVPQYIPQLTLFVHSNETVELDKKEQLQKANSSTQFPNDKILIKIHQNFVFLSLGYFGFPLTFHLVCVGVLEKNQKNILACAERERMPSLNRNQ